MHEHSDRSAEEARTFEERQPLINMRIAPELLATLPPRVASRYQEAWLVQHLSPTACAMLMGNILEAICAHEQITGASLPERLAILAQRKRLPTLLIDITHALRALRNIGSHEAEEMIEPADIPALLAGMEALLSYLYLLPRQRLVLEERLQQHPGKRRSLEQRP